jgi:hypothetical protein
VAAVLEDGLIRDARVLLDAKLLGALHGELGRRLGAAGAREALLQAGFFQGLRDALRAAGNARGMIAGRAGPVLAMLLAPAAADDGALAVAGRWPARVEAEALLASGGRRRACGCALSAGYTSGWLAGLWETDVVAVERSCAARGEAECAFVARETSDWRHRADPAALASLEVLPFAELREAVERDLGAERHSEIRPGQLDPESPAVHVWGPVMIVPYAGDQTVAAVETVSREPGGAAITVVVIDLEGVVLDDGFGALALERCLEAIHAWGAEAVLAGVAPLSQPVVDEIGHGSLVVCKDLQSAIAAAFQIAEAQRHLM